jgi:hypothetical protein
VASQFHSWQHVMHTLHFFGYPLDSTPSHRRKLTRHAHVRLWIARSCSCVNSDCEPLETSKPIGGDRDFRESLAIASASLSPNGNTMYHETLTPLLYGSSSSTNRANLPTWINSNVILERLKKRVHAVVLFQPSDFVALLRSKKNRESGFSLYIFIYMYIYIYIIEMSE